MPPLPIFSLPFPPPCLLACKPTIANTITFQQNPSCPKPTGTKEREHAPLSTDARRAPAGTAHPLLPPSPPPPPPPLLQLGACVTSRRHTPLRTLQLASSAPSALNVTREIHAVFLLLFLLLSLSLSLSLSLFLLFLL
eukprot:234762-Chlamydomonas_euryale.AAC.7